MTRYDNSNMMLGDNLYGKMLVEYLYIGMCFYGLNQAFCISAPVLSL